MIWLWYIAGFALFYIFLLVLPTKSSNYEEAEISDDDDDELFTLNDRMNSIEKMLMRQTETLERMNRIEKMSEFIESEKEKGDLLTRLTISENKKLIYEFRLSDFNNFCHLVYEDVKTSNKYEGRSEIMKKIGELWRQMPDYEKNTYKTD